MGQQRLSFLSLMSIENDIVESLTVTCREKGERDDVPRHPRQKGDQKNEITKIKRL